MYAHLHLLTLYFYATDFSQSVAYSFWSVRLCVCLSVTFSKIFSSETTGPIGFILGHNDPWVKAFKSYINKGHICKVKVTGQGQISLYKHIVKLKRSSSQKPLVRICLYYTTMILGRMPFKVI